MALLPWAGLAACVLVHVEPGASLKGLFNVSFSLQLGSLLTNNLAPTKRIQPRLAVLLDSLLA
jgi:hypothetical protein